MVQIINKDNLEAEHLPANNLSESETILKLKKQLSTLQWAFLGCGIFLSIFFTLSGNLVQNIIFLPLIGLVGYLFTRRIISLPIVVSFLLTGTIILKDTMSACFDGLAEYFFYVIIFFFLALVGALVGYIITKVTNGYKDKSLLRKAEVLFVWGMIILLSLGGLAFANSMSGNPFTACYAQFKMKHYLEATYPNLAHHLSNDHYNFKGGSYSATAYIYTEDKTNTFDVYYRGGKVWDNYFTLYSEDIPTEYRLNHEVAEEITALLKAHQIPFLTVECSLSLEKGRYSAVTFSKDTFDKPLTLIVYKLTDIKESKEDFASWCEQVRSLLVAEGYVMEELALDSDPHFMANRLSLTLKNDEINHPIKDLSSYKHFEDYGELNHFDQTLTAQELGQDGKVDFYYNENLNHEIENYLKPLNLEPLYVKASTNTDNVLDLKLYLSGERISVDHFADKVMLITDILRKNNLFSSYTIQPFSIKYVWGTDSESYYYDIYEDQLDDLSTKLIVDYILNEEDEKHY